MNRTQGFTLVEILIVLLIMSILTAIAIPTYIGYVGRAQVAEGVSVTSGLRADIVSWVWEHKEFPDNDAISSDGYIGNHASELEGKYIKRSGVSVVANSGIVIVDFDKGIISGKQLILTPAANRADKSQIVDWKCSGTVEDYLPNSCK